MTRTIFRVQHVVDGRGPFRPGLSKLWVEPRADHASMPPWREQFAHELRMLKNPPLSGCGCPTTASLRRWFTINEYSKLRALGFHAVELDADVVPIECDLQLVFVRRERLTSGARPFNLYPEFES